MTNTNLHGIGFAKGHEPPNGTLLELRVGSIPGHARVKLKLPGQQNLKDLGDLPIVDGQLELPVTYAFLSYATEDEHAVSAVETRLKQDGFLTWFAPKDLKGGDAWKDAIDEAIERSDYILVFLSRQSSTKTGYFQREIKYAFEQRELRPDSERYIIPVLLEDFEPPRSFKDIHWVEYWKPNGYERLRDSIA